MAGRNKSLVDMVLHHHSTAESPIPSASVEAEVVNPFSMILELAQTPHRHRSTEEPPNAWPEAGVTMVMVQAGGLQAGRLHPGAANKATWFSPRALGGHIYPNDVAKTPLKKCNA